ncbi:hypothetical protein L3Q82_025721 [Scortum barcoo]|uniref:Uncharacterized protein n=1 Tax=Scortum barcoo TaxID=214431 RepID=A0ACB8WKZ6_9TELE|nr:hypothetical protein L3Q82_025721 [Scortum barcoo]
MGVTESTEDLFRTLWNWCLRNNHQINTSKTKELVVDFRRRSHSPPAPVSIQGTDIDTVKYLGVHLNESLDWTDNKTNALVKKGNSRLFLLRRLRSFGVQGLTPQDLLRLCGGISHLLWDSLLGQQHHGQGQEENGQTVSRLLHPRCVKERYRRSFLPADVRLYNKQNAR